MHNLYTCWNYYYFKKILKKNKKNKKSWKKIKKIKKIKILKFFMSDIQNMSMGVKSNFLSFGITFIFLIFFFDFWEFFWKVIEKSSSDGNFFRFFQKIQLRNFQKGSRKKSKNLDLFYIFSYNTYKQIHLTYKLC